ncbi:MAG TPA: hypothetical protein VIL99_05895 [Ignavibacteria bacterium]
MEDNTLYKYWDSVKSEDFSKSFVEVENFIRKESFFGIKKTKSHESIFIKTISENKVKYAVIVASLIILFLSGKVPITQNKAIGKVVSWSMNKNSNNAIAQLDNFSWLDKSNLMVSDTVINNEEVLNYKMLIPPEIDKSQLSLIQTNLTDMGDVYGYNVFPVYEPVKRPVYAAALYSLFNFDMSSLPVNHAEIINDVSRQLEIAGIEDEVDIDFRDLNNIPGIAYIVPKKKMDSLRIKLHNDIVRNVNIEKSVGNIKKSLEQRNIAINADSIIEKIVIKLNDRALKSLSYDNEIFIDNPEIDSIIIRVENGMRKVNEKTKNIQDSVLSRMHKKMIVDIEIPDVGKIMDSVMNNIDFEELKNMNIKIFDEEELKELENLKEHDNLKELDNLDEKIQIEVDKKLKDMNIKIEMNPGEMKEFENLPDSVKSKLKDIKIKIHDHKGNTEQEEKEDNNE